MVRRNDERRAALLDAAIEVLAEGGARGLTFRAVDAEAGVPNGTTSNYFANRDQLLIQAGTRVYERLDPGEEGASEGGAAEEPSGPQDTERFVELMVDLVAKVGGFRSGYLALLELRLEAVRRPELRRLLTERVRADIAHNVAHQAASGLPGDAISVKLLICAYNWLILEQLTLPEVFDEAERAELIRAAVPRLVGEAG
ncbi:TetR family transcriptional regulator [Streptomyces sp. 3MP-14]|uniref:TetR family transcriptional regulator n=1 Tax=Streptomyces mimosae TaxID=2586635 RepID=A0A5N5ZUQ4_9ACTN|nr:MULTISPECIES: TetR/AcrR family transcriptional regulator [Streptomyces]KAB8159519.1 TetR family transcriptional regulator [Streptomyces mimosae]KAB8172797.1 TetR family transcriptional regulator [Streptomyces sp. 3MP-14]